MKNHFLYVISVLVILLVGCSSTKESTKETTTVDVQDVKILVPAINNNQTIPYDTLSESWEANTITSGGDTIWTNITEVINNKKPNQKPSLKIEQVITPALVNYRDTTTIHKTKSTEIVKEANPVMVALGNFISFVLKFLWWIIFSAVVILGVIYLLKKKIIQTLLG